MSEKLIKTIHSLEGVSTTARYENAPILAAIMDLNVRRIKEYLKELEDES